jgi:endonuclease/exonuclease/phosphatase family metal-dependent hydrolase
LCGCGRAEVSLLTYNVAGLPEGLSASSPTDNIPLMSPLLNDFDIVLVQEDFAYHHELAADAEHAYRRPPLSLDDAAASENPSGLGRFSRFPIEGFHRQRWVACNGVLEDASDCLAPKGFTVAQHIVDTGSREVAVDVYNLHMDAGDGPADKAARESQIDQLIEVLRTRSAERAVIVAGDTNIGTLGDGQLQRLLLAAELEDSCEWLACPEPALVDRVLYRGSPHVALEPLAWRMPDAFVDQRGEPLSDHQPVVVDFSLSAVPPLPPSAVDVLGRLGQAPQRDADDDSAFAPSP